MDTEGQIQVPSIRPVVWKELSQGDIIGGVNTLAYREGKSILKIWASCKGHPFYPGTFPGIGQRFGDPSQSVSTGIAPVRSCERVVFKIDCQGLGFTKIVGLGGCWEGNPSRQY
jgi:hypothetical protein